MQIERAITQKQKNDLKVRLAAEKRLVKLEQWRRQGIGSSALLNKEISRLRREYGFPMY
jgi:GNAT superfamily N-acetyltransferase